jgi:hypothetical protein
MYKIKTYCVTFATETKSYETEHDSIIYRWYGIRNKSISYM